MSALININGDIGISHKVVAPHASIRDKYVLITLDNDDVTLNLFPTQDNLHNMKWVIEKAIKELEGEDG